MIVVDTNLLAYLYIPGPRSKEARDVLRKDPLWVAPRLWRSELQSVAIKYVRGGYLKIHDAYDVMAAAAALMDGGEYEPDSRLVLDLAHATKLSTYDCEFVALARKLNLKLVSADEAVLRACPSETIDLTDFVET